MSPELDDPEIQAAIRVLALRQALNGVDMRHVHASTDDDDLSAVAARICEVASASMSRAQFVASAANSAAKSPTLTKTEAVTLFGLALGVYCPEEAETFGFL